MTSLTRSILRCDAFGAHVRGSVRHGGGFGQLRWYGANRETAEHSDGFDNVYGPDDDGVTSASTEQDASAPEAGAPSAEAGTPVIGCTRYLLRLGGDGFLSLWWRPRAAIPSVSWWRIGRRLGSACASSRSLCKKVCPRLRQLRWRHRQQSGKREPRRLGNRQAHGACGALSVILRHGDLVLMDRSIAGTRANGVAWEREKCLRVTHRAGGMATEHAPAAASGTAEAAAGEGCRSFCTLIWTNSVPRSAFLRLFRCSLAPVLRALPPAPRGGVRAWPVDPCALLASPAASPVAPAGTGSSTGAGGRRGEAKEGIVYRALRPWAPGMTLKDRQE